MREIRIFGGTDYTSRVLLACDGCTAHPCCPNRSFFEVCKLTHTSLLPRELLPSFPRGSRYAFGGVGVRDRVCLGPEMCYPWVHTRQSGTNNSSSGQDFRSARVRNLVNRHQFHTMTDMICPSLSRGYWRVAVYCRFNRHHFI